MSEISDERETEAQRAFWNTIQQARVAAQMGEYAFRLSQVATALGRDGSVLASEVGEITRFMESRTTMDRTSIPDFEAPEDRVVAIEITPNTIIEKRQPDGSWEPIRVRRTRPGRHTFMGTLLISADEDAPASHLVQVINTRQDSAVFRVVLNEVELSTITYTTNNDSTLGRPYPPVPSSAAPDTPNI